jgi:hypothetical protein
MANPEQLAKLKEGAEAWNKWRETAIEAVDLSDANLIGADLSYSNLAFVNLSGADLGHTDFDFATLNGANMSGANLEFANLRGARLGGTDLTKATFGVTTLGDTYLRNAIGLETCVHRNSSILDHITLSESGPLPLVFLRGCGLPDQFIDYIPSLFNQAIQFYSCFISYSTKDQDFADRLHADLQNKGVRCWFASEDLKIGDHFRNKIDESIRLHDKLLIVLSENSIQSPWVASEVESAFEREHKQKDKPVLFPIRLDDGVMNTGEAWAADIRRRRHIGDFSKWKDHDSYQKAFERLLRDLKADGAKAQKA